jgi:hypothetical protein
MTKEMLKFLRTHFPTGSIVTMGKGSTNHYVPIGTKGVLKEIDEDGWFLVEWENGYEMPVELHNDEFFVFPPRPHTVRYYMPMTMSGTRYGCDGWGDEDEDVNDEVEFSHFEAARFAWEVAGALKEYIDDPEDLGEYGLMEYFDEADSPAVAHKVISCDPRVEKRDGRLWGVVECQIIDELTEDEEKCLLDYVEGQMSDGFGEGFEQKPIRVDDMELYAHFWQFDGWFIKREQELFPGNGE